MTISKERKKKVKGEINWHRVISLSVAGQYIQDSLRKELEKLKVTSKPKKVTKKKQHARRKKLG